MVPEYVELIRVVTECEALAPGTAGQNSNAAHGPRGTAEVSEDYREHRAQTAGGAHHEDAAGFRGGRGDAHPGKAMKADSVKPTLKAPGSMLLKVRYGWTGFKRCFQFRLAPLHPARGAEHPDRVGAGADGVGRDGGRAVQADPIKPKLTPPGTKRLTLNSDILLSTSAFKFNLRRYTVEPEVDAMAMQWRERLQEGDMALQSDIFGMLQQRDSEGELRVWDFTRQELGQMVTTMRRDKVGRCRLTLSNPF